MIPATAHFVWFGTAFPYPHVLALRSAARHGGFERVVLHHADDLSGGEYWAETCAIEGFEARPLVPEALLSAVPEHGPALTALFARLEQPAARANMVRAALLFLEGGVYLDTDTITVASLDELRTSGVFYGVEHVVLPANVARSVNPLLRLKALGQDGLRDVCRRLPRGWRHFRKIQDGYHTAANNAVLASTPGHRFVAELLRRMATMEPRRQRVRYALGTHLLQEVSVDAAADDVTECPPPVFYPLGPEISEHWFRPGTAANLDEIVAQQTRVVHWYASVRTKTIVPKMTPDAIVAGDTAFCALARRFALAN